MKNLCIGLFILTAFAVLSCASASAPAPAPEEAPPIANFDDDLRQTYNTYQSMLDMTNSQIYTVKWGDTLSKITRRYYGNLADVGEAGFRNGFYYPVIMMASINGDIPDPDLIVSGTELKIIDLKRNLANPVSRKAIKDGLKEVAQIYNKKHKPREEAGLMRLSESL